MLGASFNERENTAWYPADQNSSTMPCVRDLSSEASGFSSEDRSSLGIYPYAANPQTRDSNGYIASFRYVPTSENCAVTDPFGYYAQQTPSYQSQPTVNNPYIWNGSNNCETYNDPIYNPVKCHEKEELPSSDKQVYRRQTVTVRHGRSNRKRRAPTLAQRRAANIRERRRMYNLNEAFDCLRQRIPTFAYEKRLSRIETLRLAISYISFMTDIVKGKDPNSLRVSIYDSSPNMNHKPKRLIGSPNNSVDDDRMIDDDEDEDRDLDDEDFYENSAFGSDSVSQGNYSVILSRDGQCPGYVRYGDVTTDTGTN